MYGQRRMAAETMAKMAANDPIIKTNYGDAAQNLLVSIARKAAADMVRYAPEFGLTALARSRLATGINAPQPPGKFDELLR